mgnify:FL=1
MTKDNTTIDSTQAKKILYDLFGLDGEASPLAGEVDFNFKIQTSKGTEFILKISRPGVSFAYLEFQQKMLNHLELKSISITTPKVFLTKNGEQITSFKDEKNQIRYVRLLSWISGRVWSEVNPQTSDLRFSLGHMGGKITEELLNFDHSEAHRNFEWDIAQAAWVEHHIHLFSKEEKEMIIHFLSAFYAFEKEYLKLRKSIVHNDANDNNCLVSLSYEHPKVISLIDFGDAIYTQIINDLAICCAYGIMHHNDPLEAALPIVRGYHKAFTLQEEELKFLYTCIAIRLIISVTKSAINKKAEPENTYLIISEKAAWEVLRKWSKINAEFAHYSFRVACDFSAHPKREDFDKWAFDEKLDLTTLFPSLKKSNVLALDLSVSSSWIGHSVDFNDLDLFQFKINQLQKQNTDCILSGGYLEPRPIYTASAYDKVGNSGNESRSIHLGIDFWIPEATPVHSPYKGKVVMAVIDQGEKTYGGMIVLQHEEDRNIFFSLYGHLSEDSVLSQSIGNNIAKGEQIGCIGSQYENGNWSPHLHFQLMLSTLDFHDDFPGVIYPNQKKLWKGICPDPNLLFKLHPLKENRKDEVDQIKVDRDNYLGRGMSLQYEKPLHIVRGEGIYLIDSEGRKYIDMVNNVAHVGHEHPKVVKAGKQQMSILNTNSRYLHANITQLAKTLASTLPPELNVFHFVNSGSEANELALRMAKGMTGSKEVFASEVGYHGNTNSCIDISSYKFDGKGGSGKPESTHIFPLPDSFRGKYQGESTGIKYAEEVQHLIDTLKRQKKKIGAFIIEPIISCGGQIELPTGFLKKAYKMIRNEGGVCISDEVQTGCGRMGSVFWGFQLHDVVPDIVTIGKPLGNGHPVAAVACTKVVAENFANGMEFFNTFGGNPVSTVIASTVLDIVIEENLQENAREVGAFLKEELLKLSKKFPIMGCIRGQGLFLGIELVDYNNTPLEKQATYLVNRMKEHGVLLSTDGPAHNVIKIKPPLVFSKQNANQILYLLNKVFQEDLMKLN